MIVGSNGDTDTSGGGTTPQENVEVIYNPVQGEDVCEIKKVFP